MNEALGLIHKQPGAERGLRLLAFDLVAREAYCSFFPEKRTMVRPALAHPCATAHQPKSSRSKNSLIGPVFFLTTWFSFSLVLVSFSVSFMWCSLTSLVNA